MICTEEEGLNKHLHHRTNPGSFLGKFLNKTQLNEPWSVTPCYTCEIIKGKIRTVFPANFCFKSGGCERALLLLCSADCSVDTEFHQSQECHGVTLSPETQDQYQYKQGSHAKTEGKEVKLWSRTNTRSGNDFSSIIVF